MKRYLRDQRFILVMVAVLAGLVFYFAPENLLNKANIIGGIAAAIAAWFSYKVSRDSHKLSESIRFADSPNIFIWFNGTEIIAPKVISSLSFVNTGKEAMPIRTLRLIGTNGQAMKFKLIEKTTTSHYVEKYKEIMDSLSSYAQQETDVILSPNIVYQAYIAIQSGQFKVEAMYYDNTFEFVEIDSSILGGKYRLTGRGKRL